ncbi:MAG: hypothetical protein QOK16_3315 [Solirubrobacteraceae bacterium]|nr:hypothetical protein [Solirubrobacteraceae bacterium]
MVVVSVDPTSLVLKVAPKLAPLGMAGVRLLLGLNDFVRLMSLVKRDVKRSSEIAHGKHDLVWEAVNGQRSDPVVAGCLIAYLTQGDMSAAGERLRARLTELLRFEDDTINDGRVVDLVVRSVEQNLSKAPLKDRDAMRLELALTRAAIDDLADRVKGTDAQTGRAVALETALIPVGANVSSPARLLRARSGILPYTAREEILSRLDGWTHAPGAFAACLVGGRGGSGKTRLGVELARHASRAGWLSGMLISAASPAAIQALVQIDAARLIVVDYAETRGEQLEVLLPWLAATATAEHPVRVLLLVRSAPRPGKDWAAVLRDRGDALDVVLDDVEQHLLEDLPLELAERHAVFASATQAFAARQNTTLDMPAAVTDELGQSVFTSPLMVVIAAYLAVHDPAGALPGTRSGLLDELLAHERRYWKASADSVCPGTDDVLRRRVVALATLAGAASEAQATDLLRVVPDLQDESVRERGRLARWAHGLYPSGPAWWNPLEPDLLGEHLIARTYTDHPAVLTAVLQRDSAHAIVQPLGVFARAAPDHPEFAAALRGILSSQLSALCELAVALAATETNLDLLLGDTTLAAALNRAVTVVEPDPSVLAGVLDALPQRSDLVLGPLALTLTSQLTNHVRRLAAANAAAYEPALAMSLNNLSLRLAEAGRRDEGLAAIEEAVEVYRRLAAANAAAYEPDLATSLNNLSVDLAEAGRRDEGLAAIEEAVEVYRRLAAANAAAYEPDLATSLNNLSNRLAEAGRDANADSARLEADELMRGSE